MNNKIRINEKIESRFSDLQVDIIEENRLRIDVERESVLTLLQFLKTNAYDHLALVSCVDRIDENLLELIYIVSPYMQTDESYTEEEKVNLILKTTLPRENPQIGTAIEIFETAEPYERELHEMFGIEFTGHPRLTPLFLEREYDIPPLRKDFDTRAYVEERFDSIPPVED